MAPLHGRPDRGGHPRLAPREPACPVGGCPRGLRDEAARERGWRTARRYGGREGVGCDARRDRLSCPCTRELPPAWRPATKVRATDGTCRVAFAAAPRGREVSGAPQLRTHAARRAQRPAD